MSVTENQCYSLINGIPSTYLDVDDRAIHYGDGVFETVLCHDKNLFFWTQHYHRLKHSAEVLDFHCPEEKTLLADIGTLLANNTESNQNSSAIKIILTRGTGRRGYRYSDDADNNRLLSLSSLETGYSSLLAETLISGELYRCKKQVSINESLAGHKHLNRLENVLARAEWQGQPYIDGLMSDADANIIEGTMSNIFAVREGQLFTPDLRRSGVAGVMRKFILQLAEQAGYTVSIRDMNIDQVQSMDELFITNSLIGMKSISRFADTEYLQTANSEKIFNHLLAARAEHVHIVD